MVNLTQKRSFPQYHYHYTTFAAGRYEQTFNVCKKMAHFVVRTEHAQSNSSLFFKMHHAGGDRNGQPHYPQRQKAGHDHKAHGSRPHNAICRLKLLMSDHPRLRHGHGRLLQRNGSGGGHRNFTRGAGTQRRQFGRALQSRSDAGGIWKII